MLKQKFSNVATHLCLLCTSRARFPCVRTCTFEGLGPVQDGDIKDLRVEIESGSMAADWELTKLKLSVSQILVNFR